MSAMKRTLHTPHSYIKTKYSAPANYSLDLPHTLTTAEDIKPMVLENIVKVPYHGGGAFTVCDFGTADGSSSITVWRACIETLRKKHGKALEFNIAYEDQATSDFKTLFQILHGCLEGRATYLTEYDGVFVTASGTSFFDQCLPSNSLHFGYSTLAMHYLRERPCKLSDAIHHTVSSMTDEVAQYAAQAAKDWEEILLKRGKELVPGGRMVCVLSGRGENGENQGDGPRPTGCVFRNLGQIMQELIKEGRITQDEFAETNFIQYCSTEAELIAPFKDLTSPVFKAGLRLISSGTRLFPCIFHEEWMKKKGKDDADVRAHAQGIIRSTSSWMYPTLWSGLSKSRSELQRDELVDEIYKRFTERIIANPDDHGFNYVNICVCFEKV